MLAGLWGQVLPLWHPMQVQSPPAGCHTWGFKKGVTINRDGGLVYQAWDALLAPDDPKRDYILNGIAEGFRITTMTDLIFVKPITNLQPIKPGTT